MWFHQVMLNPGGRSRKRLRAPQKREVTEMTNPGLCETRLATALRDHPLRIFTLTGARAGPVLALIGAVHGDELEGPLTLSALMQSLDPAEMAGTLILCPAANPEALAASTRCSPSDGRNLARCFPGDPEGSPTEVLAALLARHVIRPADALIDLHSGGGPVHCPLFAGYGDAAATGSAARAMARAFGAPVVWRHPAPLPPGRTMSEAQDAGIPSIYIEAGGGIVPPPEIVSRYEDGVRGVMAHLGMLDQRPDPGPAPLQVAGSGDLDHAIMAPVSGLCHCRVDLLAPLRKGDICFDITDLDGRVLASVPAEADGIAMFLRRSRWVSQGDLLMASAHPDD
jgi:predicted deacylase